MPARRSFLNRNRETCRNEFQQQSVKVKLFLTATSIKPANLERFHSEFTFKALKTQNEPENILICIKFKNIIQIFFSPILEGTEWVFLFFCFIKCAPRIPSITQNWSSFEYSVTLRGSHLWFHRGTHKLRSWAVTNSDLGLRGDRWETPRTAIDKDFWVAFHRRSQD
jgi:hypothetical protein